jgi:hypothetical protein
MQENEGGRRGASEVAAGRRRIVAALLAGKAAPAADDEAEEARSRERRLARVGWSLERIDALKRAQKAMDAAWMAMLAPYDDVDEEDLPDFDPPPEEAAVEAILAEINAALREDRWPAHLHWSL